MMTNDFLIEDARAREHIRAHLDQTLFVEASAGTGKTAALVDRFLHLVLAGRTVDRIVAITFTDKAAAELRDRVRQGLEARLKQECTDAERALIEKALHDLDRAEVSTIHAFCQSLLRSFAVRAGIDPAFEIEDVVAAERRFEERWRTYLDGLGTDTQAVDAVGRLLDLGLTHYNLQDLAKNLWQRTELAQRLQEEPLAAPDIEWPDLGVLHEDLASIDMTHVPQADGLRKRIGETLQKIADLRSTGLEERDARLASIASDLRPATGSLGNQGNWRGSGDLKDARDITHDTIQCLIDTLDGLRAKALADALPLFVDFVTLEARARREEGRLVFDDLILGVRDVLRAFPSARDELRQRYDTILIDEFQDTDPLQAEIALAFAAASDDNAPDAGRLFLVGDPKQSIYRFRRADMAIYASTRERIAVAGGETIDLALNRRSQPGVLTWVNKVFERVIGPGVDIEIQPPYRPVHPYRNDTLEGPTVAWLGQMVAAGASATQVRQMEAQYVAAHCRGVVDRGWQVTERDGTIRPARYGDIAVLLPARTILQPLERSLAAEGIPYRVEGGSLVYATQEVRDLLNCLTAIDDPSDDVAVVAALRSPAYACSDVEIARYRLEFNGSFNYLSPALNDFEGIVPDGLRSLRAWHLQRAGLSLAVLVERFVADRRIVEIGLLDSGNRNAYRRARFVVEQARQFEAAGPESLRSFLEWLERRAGDAILDSEGASLDDDEDAVRVLTVHAAKGLEFPIVFLGGLGTPPVNTTPVFGHDRNDERIAVNIGAKTRKAQFKLGPVDSVDSHEKLHAEAERARLLYVGATRARDHLVVSLFHQERTRDCAALKLIGAGAKDYAVPMPPVTLSQPVHAQPFANLQTDLEGWDESTFEAERAVLVTNAHVQRYTSATALGRQDETEDKEEQEDDTEPWSRGRAGTHLGRAVHAALQTLAWDAGDDEIEAVARAQTVAEAVPHLADEAATLIRVALQSQPAQRALAAKRALREVPFALPHGNTILEGYVDLLLEAEDGSIEIVDWKTDHVPPESVEDRLRNYRLQAGVYVLGIEAATGRPVSRVTYVFVSPNRTDSPGEPAALKAIALQRLETALTPV
jgi:ATP-dependent helicase/nuclease subunit A